MKKLILIEEILKTMFKEHSDNYENYIEIKKTLGSSHTEHLEVYIEEFINIFLLFGHHEQAALLGFLQNSSSKIAQLWYSC